MDFVRVLLGWVAEVDNSHRQVIFFPSPVVVVIMRMVVDIDTGDDADFFRHEENGCDDDDDFTARRRGRHPAFGLLHFLLEGGDK